MADDLLYKEENHESLQEDIKNQEEWTNDREMFFNAKNVTSAILPIQECRKTAYISLVRPTIEYCAIVWHRYPYMATNINKLNRIQRQAAGFIAGDYKSREEGWSQT